MKDWPKLIYAILICEFAGIIGSFFTTPSIKSWYSSLIKPAFNPPNWIFAPVWTLLFLLMGISFYLIWREGFKTSKSKTASLFFCIQLGLNVLWSILFFGMHNPLLAFIEIILLWIAILLTTIYFYKISKPAAYLMIPYLLWVGFAAVLNYTIMALN